MAHHELALHALSFGIDKIPDKFWHSIPGGYFKPKELEKVKEKAKEKVESLTHHQRRRSGSEYNGRRSGGDEDRGHRPRRAASLDGSDYSDDEADREHRRGRERRERGHGRKSEREYRDERPFDNSNHRASLGGLSSPTAHRPSTAPSPYPPQVYNPAAYAGSPVGQQIPYQYPASHAPPMTYSGQESARSSRSSSAQPMWSGESSRRSSTYQQNNYSPPTGYSPPKHSQTMPTPPHQAWHSHPAYHGGAPLSAAASKYTPAQHPSLHIYTQFPAGSDQQSPIPQPQQNNPQYASPSATPTQHSPFPNPQLSPFVLPQYSPLVRSQTSPAVQSQASPVAGPQLSPLQFPQFQHFSIPPRSPQLHNSPYSYPSTYSPYQQPAALQSPPPFSLQNPLSRHGSISNRNQQHVVPGTGAFIGPQQQHRSRRDSASSGGSNAAYSPRSRTSSLSVETRHDGGRRESISRRDSFGRKERSRHHNRTQSGRRERLEDLKDASEG
ncbi:hypothetical protein NA57DRAFT_76834 [Rhizodiscina lignyota]|uniref:Uncharacterized protein n=1 Tax=Rhizodiscina lignyota TaxID=1504668 RepID=A0A9P4M866_9PEZI|nr:hypothetical protein NA57DRAFT_76834 [Rhizodiscina lignyota]